MDILLSVAFTFIEQISNNMDYYFIFFIICLPGKKKIRNIIVLLITLLV